jgi:hypothetical protein
VLTAVQLRPPPVASELAFGRPRRTELGSVGPIALLAPGHVAAYAVRSPQGARLFVFRTRARLLGRCSKVPGVAPSVHLLLIAKGRRASSRILRFLRWLAGAEVDVDTLTDAFWARLSALTLARSKLRRPVLVALLNREVIDSNRRQRQGSGRSRGRSDVG